MADTEDELLAIGEVARRSGLRPSALRFYEKAGLLVPPLRASGRRRYERGVLRRLAIIDVAQRAGFSLAEIRELLEGFDAVGHTSPRWRSMARRKLEEVQALIERAHTMKRLLEEGLSVGRLGGSPWGYPSPFAYLLGPGLTHASLLFDTLLWKDAAGALVPWLARAWRCSEDGTQWRFTIRRDVRWHDGRPLSPGDVVFSFQYLTSGPGATSGVLHLQGLEEVRSVAVHGDDVVFRLRRPYVPFAEWIAGRMLITPEHVWAEVDRPVEWRDPCAVMGSGPYRLDGVDEAKGRYLYEANDAYFAGPPYLQKLQFLPVADELEALAEGRLDAAPLDVWRGVSDDALARFDEPLYEKIVAPGQAAIALHFNLSRGFPYDDGRFRRAVAHALDRDRLVAHVLYGRGEPGSMGGLIPSHPFVAHDLPAYDVDPAKANALFDALGLRRRNGSSARCLPDGTPFRPELRVCARSAPVRAVANLVRRDLAAAGIDVRVQRLDAFAARAASQSGSYEMLLYGYGGLGGDPDWLRIQLSSKVTTNMHARIHGYRNPRFDQLADRQRTVAEAGERRRLVQQMQRLVADDVPLIPLYVPTRMVIFPAKSVFDAWYFTPGGVWGGYPGPVNKHALVSGRNGAPLA